MCQRTGVAALGAACVELIDDGGALHELLHAVLAKIGVTEGDELADVLDRRVLGHRHKHHVARAASALLGGARDAGLHIVVALSQRARVRHGNSHRGGRGLHLHRRCFGGAGHRDAGRVSTLPAAHKRRSA
jgi:hypothetical protein